MFSLIYHPGSVFVLPGSFEVRTRGRRQRPLTTHNPQPPLFPLPPPLIGYRQFVDNPTTQRLAPHLIPPPPSYGIGTLDGVTLCAEGHADGCSPDPAVDHALPQFGQPRRGVQLAAVLAGGVLPAGPEHLAGSARPGPEHDVEVDRVDGLAPSGHLAAEDSLRLLRGEAGGGVVRVDEAPALGGGAPVVEGEVGLECQAVVEGLPLASTAVEVLCFMGV